MTEATTVAEITNQKPATLLKAAEPKAIRHDSEKWLKFFLNNKQIAFMRKLREAAITAPIGTHASIDVGVVTGKNEFFVLSDEQVTALGLNGHTVPLVSRSVQLKGSRLRKANWKSLSAAGDRVHLLHISPAQGQRLSRKLRAYITAASARNFTRAISARSESRGSPCLPSGFRMALHSGKFTISAHGTECLGCHVDGHHPSTQKQGRGARTYHGVVARIVTSPHDAHRQDSYLPMRYDTGRPRAVIRFKISQPRATSLPCPAGLWARRPSPMMDL